MADPNPLHHRPRKRKRVILVVAATIALILSSAFLIFPRTNRHDPISPSLVMSSPRDPISDDSNRPKHDNKINDNKSDHDDINLDRKKGKRQTYPQIAHLPPSLLPTNTSGPQQRLVIIGDVHGHLKPLEKLLSKINFSSSSTSTSSGGRGGGNDTVVFVGDMVNKGPDSAGVVDLAMRIGAYGVRGNHEEKVLRAWEALERKKKKDEGKGRKEKRVVMDSDDDDLVDEMISDDDDGNDDNMEELTEENEDEGKEEEEDEEAHTQNGSHETKHGKNGNKKKKKKHGGKHGGGNKDKHKKKKKIPHKDQKTAKSLSPAQRKWLSELPLILRLGDLGPRYGEGLVVHAGLVPGVPLAAQDPEAVMTMRTLLVPSEEAEQEGGDREGSLRNPGAGTTTEVVDDELAFHVSHIDFDLDYDSAVQVPLDSATDATLEEVEGEDQARNNNDQEVEKKKKHPKPKHPSKMIPSDSRDGIPWAEVWTSYQRAYSSHSPLSPATAIYGHDSKAGIQLREYALGIDSGCGNAGRLTAVIFSFDESTSVSQSESSQSASEYSETYGVEEIIEGQGRHNKARIRHQLVSVSCKEMS
ncbi:Metallo-dependent phosphatase [Astrocystis sublimbata]|nr:Metallo-dependent phosphatase [Astrocystis sublimbata]